jgi:Rrf2 family nitric oxide-sensitive transcriptional repressor
MHLSGGATMRLTLYTDYSLKLLMYLALKDERLATIQEISEAYGISRNHLMKIAQKLGQAGIVETVRGRGGGLRLARAAENVPVGEIVRLTEDDTQHVECFAAETDCCRITSACRLRVKLREALAAYYAVLDEVTLAELVARPQPLKKLLALSA